MNGKIVKNDNVMVIKGKDRGKTGQVMRVLAKEGKVVIAGINVYKKASKASKKNPQGGIIEVVKPVEISNIALVCPSCNKPTRIGYLVAKNGAKDRICKRCKSVIKEN